MYIYLLFYFRLLLVRENRHSHFNTQTQWKQYY
nr:MAG TPA: hypothetical protein [Caudoviricetes sp.]